MEAKPAQLFAVIGVLSCCVGALFLMALFLDKFIAAYNTPKPTSAKPVPQFRVHMPFRFESKEFRTIPVQFV